jgi:hypothetical protein
MNRACTGMILSSDKSLPLHGFEQGAKAKPLDRG